MREACRGSLHRGSPAAWLLLAAVLLLAVPGPTPGLPGARIAHPGPVTASTGRASLASAAEDAAGAASALSPAFDWASFHGSGNRSGYSPAAGPANANGGWFSCPSPWPIRSGPVATAHRVYAADYFGTVFALDRSRPGAAVWNRSLGAGATQLELAGTKLLAATAANRLIALDAASGTPVWSQTLSAAPVESPLVWGNTVYVATGSGAVDAFDLTDGTVTARFSLPGPPAGALATDGVRLYAATTSGTVLAMTPAGSSVWAQHASGLLGTTPAVSQGVVAIGTLGGQVLVWDAATGALRWRAWVPDAALPEAVRTPPAIGPGVIYAASEAGGVNALSLANGSTLWTYTSIAGLIPYLSAPAVAPNGVYVVDNSLETLEALAPAKGRVLWTASLFNESYSSPAVDNGQVLVGTEGGCVLAFGSPGGVAWPVSGHVTDRAGAPIAGASVRAGSEGNLTDASGRFSLALPNGTYSVSVTALLRNPVAATISVRGPLTGLRFILSPLTVYLVTGVVLDADSGRGIVGARVSIQGAWGFQASVASATDGSFRLAAPNGTNGVSVAPPGGFGGFLGPLTVHGAAVSGFAIPLTPLGLAAATGDPWYLSVWLPVGAVVSAAVALRAWELKRRRAALGLPRGLLSPFGRFVVMRALVVPAQATALSTLLFVFEVAIPGGGVWSGCGAAGSPVGAPVWAQYGTFLRQLYTGEWGCATLGNFSAPVSNVIGWWLPQSVELAFFALLFALAFAYPVGLWMGWRPGGPTDRSVRAASLVGLLTPSFVVALGLLLVLYPAFLRAFGDAPYGTLPSIVWFSAHGGVPGWIGVAENTIPTGFPLIDGALNGDWGFERITFAKTLLQALVVAVVYVTIFLRYARAVVLESARELHLLAARARGVPEPRLLWRHMGRRVLPFYLLVFGLTLPAYLGTQALVEALFGDFSVGSLLFFDSVESPLFAVAVFLLVVAVLVGTLAADVLARYLDPRLLRRSV